MPVDAKGDEEGAALGMAARSQGLVRMMTQTTTTHPREIGRAWSLANSREKNNFIHTYSYTHIVAHMVVHTCMYDGEGA